MKLTLTFILATIFAVAASAAPITKSKGFFANADTNNDGTVDAKEIDVQIAADYAKLEGSKPSAEEYATAVKAELKPLDGNGDGSLTDEERMPKVKPKVKPKAESTKGKKK